MKIIGDKLNRKGHRQITVTLDPGEQLIAVDPSRHYKLGYPIEDIIVGHIIRDSVPVLWCSIEQKWID